MLGLKENLATFADIIREKDQQYNLLLEKHNTLLMELPRKESFRVKALDSVPSSKTIIKDTSLLRRHQDKDKDKENKVSGKVDEKRCKAVLE